MFSMEITRLIERCRQGDTDALGELYITFFLLSVPVSSNKK